MNISSDKESKIKSAIIGLLKKHPEGLTIADISRMLALHRQTITKYIFELKGEGRIHRRIIGAVSLHYLMEHWNGGRGR